MTEQAECSITFLQERRAALISAGFTCKMDMRGVDNQHAEAA
jgi:hypothetical protein